MPAKKRATTKRTKSTAKKAVKKQVVAKKPQSVWSTPLLQKEQEAFMKQHPNMRSLLITFMIVSGAAVVWASLVYISPVN